MLALTVVLSWGDDKKLEVMREKRFMCSHLKGCGADDADTSIAQQQGIPPGSEMIRTSLRFRTLLMPAYGDLATACNREFVVCCLEEAMPLVSICSGW
jgi:hypothetical protein